MPDDLNTVNSRLLEVHCSMSKKEPELVLFELSLTVKAAPHECVNRTGLLKTWV